MRRRHTIRWLTVTALALCAALPLAAFAQQPQPQVQAQSGSTEIPARLRHLEGTVTVQRAAAGETEGGVVNLPLGSGDRVWTEDDGRVQITFEDGTSVWLDNRTTLDFVSLPRPEGSEGALVRLWRGSAYIHRPVPYGAALAPLRIDAPSGSALFDQEGLFRLDVDDDQTVWLSAYDGGALLDAGGLSERVSAGQRTLAESGSAPARAVAFNTSEADDFSIWRDQRLAQYASTQEYTGPREYLPANVAHYAADLEPYGSWSYHPTYASWYWKPYAAVAWTPYRDGRWVYTYAGWNWVPTASWGYVTTHYGRWHYGGSGWIWFPGRVWQPASVHWYVGGGYVGWVPLNYYGRPAVSFGAYFGGGVGVSVNVNFGGGYGYGYPYYGYGHSYWGYRPYYRCCNYYGRGGNRWKWGRDRYPYPNYYTSNRGRGDRVPPSGSASGRGRVINGRGYSSGLGDAWTMVPADDFSTASVGRRAVRRGALPRGLDQASNAELSGNLRARRPGNLVPDTTRRAVPRGDVARPVGVNGNPGAARATTGGAGSRGSAQPRVATPRQNAGNPAVTNGAARRANGTPSTTGRAVRRNGDPPSATTPQRTTTAPRAVRRTGNPPAATTGQGGRTAPSAVRRAGDQPSATAPQSGRTAPRAVRRRGDQPAATTPQRTTTAPRAVRRNGNQPAATSPQRTPAVRRTVPGTAVRPDTRTLRRTPSAPQAVRRPSPRRSATTPQRAPAPRTLTPPRGGSAVRSRTAVPGARQPRSGSEIRSRAAAPPASRSPSPSVTPRSGANRPTVTPRSVTRPSSGARRAAPSVRPSRPSTPAAPRGGVRRAAPSGRTAPVVRPAPSGPSRPSVGRPAAPPRSGRGTARPRRAAKPRGGSGGT